MTNPQWLDNLPSDEILTVVWAVATLIREGSEEDAAQAVALLRRQGYNGTADTALRHRRERLSLVERVCDYSGTVA